MREIPYGTAQCDCMQRRTCNQGHAPYHAQPRHTLHTLVESHRNTAGCAHRRPRRHAVLEARAGHCVTVSVHARTNTHTHTHTHRRALTQVRRPSRRIQLRRLSHPWFRVSLHRCRAGCTPGRPRPRAEPPLPRSCCCTASPLGHAPCDLGAARAAVSGGFKPPPDCANPCSLCTVRAAPPVGLTHAPPAPAALIDFSRRRPMAQRLPLRFAAPPHRAALLRRSARTAEQCESRPGHYTPKL